MVTNAAHSWPARKTWTPKAALQRFTQSVMSVPHARHKQLVEQVCEAIVEVAPEVVAHAEDKPGFRELAKQILHTWNRGILSLKANSTYAVPDLKAQLDAVGFSNPAPLKTPKPECIGRSELLGPKGTF